MKFLIDQYILYILLIFIALNIEYNNITEE